MTLLEAILESDAEEQFLIADGLDEAVIGYYGDILVYSKRKILKILQTESQMSREEAIEYYYFNIEGAYVGKQTPIFVEDDLLL
jgi:hypothetical protein